MAVFLTKCYMLGIRKVSMASAGAFRNIELDLIQLLENFAVSDSRSEPANLEFKSDFDGLKSTWLDILKHVVAMANSGGGTLIFGVDKDGNRVGIRASLLQTFDPANVSNKLRSFTSGRVASAYRELECAGKLFGFLQIALGERLVVFESDGNYQGSDGKPGRAFIKGVVYTRIPGSTREAEQVDLDALTDRIVQARVSRILARIEHVAHAPLESDLVISRSDDNSRGVVVERSLPVRIFPESQSSTETVPLHVRIVVNDPDAVLVSEIADPAVPFSSVDLELQTQLRLWRHSDASHRVSRSALCKLYVHRDALTISPEAAEMCFISAAYGRGYPMFWAGRMDRGRLREVINREVVYGKSPMTETLPFVVCAFMWEERHLLSEPTAKTMRKLKARNIVSRLLKLGSQSEFLRRGRKGASSLDVDGRRYSIQALVADRASASAVLDRLVELEYKGGIKDKQRNFAHRLDLIVHADTK